MRTEKKSPPRKPRTAMRKRKTGKKAEPATHEASDRSQVAEPRGGYAHVGNLDNPFPTADQITRMDLGGDYEKGKVPAAVMYGRRQVVLSQMLAGVPTFDVLRSCASRYGMSETMTRYLIHEIRAEWRRDNEEQSAYARVEAITRVKRDLASMRAEKKKPWQAIRSHETLLSRMEGTMQPLAVKVFDASEEIKDALSAVIGGMSEEDLTAYVTDGEEVADDELLELPAAE